MISYASSARVVRRYCPILGGSLLVIFLLAGPLPAEEPKAADTTPARPKVNVEPCAVEVRLADGSVLKLTLREDKFNVATEFGKLAIPVADVSRIEFATRISDDVAKRIKAAVAKLGSDVFSEREQASKELLKIGVPAYASLKEALKSDDQEVKRHAEELVSKIEASASAEVLEVRKDDVIHTKDMKIKGQIENVTFKTDFSALGRRAIEAGRHAHIAFPGFRGA